MKIRRFLSIALVGLLLFGANAATGAAQLFESSLVAHAETSVKVDEALVDTYQKGTEIVNAPTVVCDAIDYDTLEGAITAEWKPSNIILRLNEDCEVVDDGGTYLDSFERVYKRLDHKIIPIVRIEDQGSAKAFIRYMQEELNILDVAVLSSDPILVKQVRNACEYVRGIVLWEEGSFTSDYEIVSVTNESGANVALLPQALATRERVEYIQARFKTVWVMPEENSEICLRGCINSGAYGIVTEDVSYAYHVMKLYPESFVRSSFNVAHRGLPDLYNENSLSGTKAALAAGATHVELDGKVTTDGKILMMHDSDISRTTNGKGNIENMTYEQARQYKLDLQEPKDETIPSLDEIMEFMKDTDAILVFEIKTNKEAIIQPLKEAIERHDFWDQIVVIAFDTIQLERMRAAMPQVPTANLNDAKTSTFAACLKWMGVYNTGVDTSKSNISQDFNERYLRDRGIIGWYWTYSGYSGIDDAVENGYIGITNNNADTYGEEIREVNKAGYALQEGETFDVWEGDEIELTLTRYNGTQEMVVGKVEKAEDLGDYYGIIASYRAKGTTLTYYTELIRVNKYVKAVDGNGTSFIDTVISQVTQYLGCASSINVNATRMTLYVGCGVVALLLVMKARDKKKSKK